MKIKKKVNIKNTGLLFNLHNGYILRLLVSFSVNIIQIGESNKEIVLENPIAVDCFSCMLAQILICFDY